MTSDTQAKNLSTVEKHFHGEATADVAAALDTFTEDVVWEALAPNGINRSFTGKRDVAENYRRLWISMKDIEWEAVDRFAGDDRVVDDSIIRFTVAQEGYWSWPAGSRIEMRLVHIFEMCDGKISKEKVFDMGKVSQ